MGLLASVASQLNVSLVKDLLGTIRLYPVAAATTLALLIVGLTMVRGVPSDKAQEKGAPKAGALRHGDNAANPGFLRDMGAPDHPHEEGSFVPSRGLVVNNRDVCDDWDNEFCMGSLLSLHRATHDRDLDKSGNYPHGKYFLGKRRLWEARIQLRFKVPPESKDVYFGIELERFVPMIRGSKRMMDMVVGMLKGVVGDQVYHSVGEDPKVVSGELERPVFVMPLWAFDQFIVTPEGEHPPSLTDPGLPSMGSLRVKRVKEFKREMDELRFRVGPTYTFCFWGISQWLDKLNWQIRVPLMSPLDFNTFCGSPPVHVVLYTLKPGSEKRHLQSRKNYYFDLAFWSSKVRPPAERIRELLGVAPAGQLDRPTPAAARGGASWLRCCVGR